MGPIAMSAYFTKSAITEGAVASVGKGVLAVWSVCTLLGLALPALLFLDWRFALVQVTIFIVTSLIVITYTQRKARTALTK